MARTTTTGQAADLTTAHRRETVQVWVANSLDTLVNFTADLLSWSITGNVNQNGRTASVTLNREDSGGSLAPDMNATAPIAVGRRVELRVMVDDHASSSSVQTVFQGKVQRVSWGGTGAELQLTIRDGWGELEDTWIESESTYGSVGGTAIQTVIQSILTDSGTGLTLTTVGSPTTVIYEYTQRRQSVAQAIKALADVNGWTLRFAWNGSSYVLTFEEPARNKTIPDWTFTAADYRTLSSVSRDSTRIRNRCTVVYSTGGGAVTTTDTTSTGEHGRRFMFVDASRDPQITTTGAASTLGSAIVGDLAQPLVAQQADMRFWWAVELGDLCRFPADNVFRNATADLAVVGYTHSGTAGSPAKTMLDLRGTPSGGTLRWTRLAERTERAQQLTNDGVGQIDIPQVKRAPSIRLATTQTATGGTVTMTVDDPDGVVNAHSFLPATGGSTFDDSTAPSGWVGYDAAAPYDTTATVPIVGGHASRIAAAVRYDLGDGSGNQWKGDSVSFDLDTVPRFSCGLSLTGSTVWLSHTGDEDTGSIRYLTSSTGIPATGGIGSGTVVAGQDSDGTAVATGVAEGATVYVRARAYTTSGGGGTSSPSDFTGQVQRPTDTNTQNPRAPVVAYTTKTTGGNGAIQLTVLDPDSTVNAHSFENATGGAPINYSTGTASGWTGFDAVAPYDTTYTVPIAPDHSSSIAYGVRFDLGEGAGNQWKTGVVQFDPDLTPDFTASLHRVNTSVYLSWSGDNDVGSIRYLTSTTGTPATGGIGAGTVATGAGGEVLLTSGLAASGTLYVRARGYTGAAGTGTESLVDWIGRLGESVPDGSVTTSKVAANAIAAAKMTRQAQAFVSDVKFIGSTYFNTSWQAGTITLADGTSTSISAGNTGTMTTNTTYFIYYNGTSTLQVTSIITDVTSDEGNLLMCTTWRSANTSAGKANIVPAVGTAGYNSFTLSNDAIATNAIEAANIRANTITAAKIASNTITANEIASNTITANELSVGTLSAITADVGTLTAGVLQNTASTTFIDLGATGSQTFIKCGTDLTVTANGSATFGGTVSSATFTASQINVTGGDLNVYGAGGGVVACDQIQQTGGASQISLVGGIIKFGSPFEIQRPGINATGAILVSSGNVTTIRNQLTVSGDLVVLNDVTLGNASTDTVTVSGDLVCNGDVQLGGATTDNVGFYGSSGSTKPTITGSRNSNAALQDLLVSLAGMGLIVNNTSA